MDYDLTCDYDFTTKEVEKIDWLRLPDELKKYEKEVSATIAQFDLQPMVLSHSTILSIARDVARLHDDLVMAQPSELCGEVYKPLVQVSLDWLDSSVHHYEQLTLNFDYGTNTTSKNE